MKQKIVGDYVLDYASIRIVLREGLGGEFYFVPETGQTPSIKIGAEYDNWGDVVKVLFHEAFEMLCAKRNHRFHPNGVSWCNHESYLFSFRHQDLSEMSEAIGLFLADALPDLAKGWKAWKRGAA